MEEIQDTFDFPVTFEVYTGTCSCGEKYTCKRASIVIEMTIRCAKCDKIIQID